MSGRKQHHHAEDSGKKDVAAEDVKVVEESSEAATKRMLSCWGTDDDGETHGHPTRHVFPGMCVIAFVLLWGGANLAVNIHRIISVVVDPGEDVTAFDVARLSNDICSIVLCLLVYLLWRTLCFKAANCRHIWSWKPWVFPDTMMPGGFIPRPAAVSLGLLMFMSEVFIQERVVPGNKLFERDNRGWHSNKVAHGEWCRADVREEASYNDHWWSRLQRSNPSGCYFGPCAENSTDAGCTPGHTGPSFPKMFDGALNTSFPDGGEPWPNLIHPYDASTHILMNFYSTLKGLAPSIFGKRRHGLVSETHINHESTCLYQCVKWRVWGFNTCVSKAGTIFAGAAIVTKFTESVSGVLGSQRVTEDTPCDKLGDILRRIKPDEESFMWRRFHKSALVPALLFLFIRIFFAFWVFKIDDYGFFTVDYYVTQVLFFAIFNSILLRSFNPFRFERIAYTANLWNKGADSFVIVPPSQQDKTEEGKAKYQDLLVRRETIDLFVWVHMSHQERAYLLINYARMISADSKKAQGSMVMSLVKHSHHVKVPLRSADILKPSGSTNGAFSWDEHKVMEHRSVDVPVHSTGVVQQLQGQKALVLWNPDSGEKDGDVSKEWIERLKAMQDVAWDKATGDRNRASSTLVSVHELVEIDEDWDNLMKEACGDLAEQDKLKVKILKRVTEDTYMKGSKSWWQTIRRAKCTNEKTDQRLKARKDLARATSAVSAVCKFKNMKHGTGLPADEHTARASALTHALLPKTRAPVPGGT